MTAIAASLEAFFTERLGHQCHASAHTVTAYRDTFKMLFRFAANKTGKAPSDLGFEDLDAQLVGAFLEHLEHERSNSVRTRNARLAAIRSFFRYASYREPAHADSIARVLSIPEKRMHRSMVTYLTAAESAALLAVPDRNLWVGRRDHALLVTALQTGTRVSELRLLSWRDVVLANGAHLVVHGKGRKERATPLTRHTVSVLRTWAKETTGQPDHPVFPSRRHGPLSSDAVSDLVAKYRALAAVDCPTLATKTVTPHTLRHTCAMRLLEAGVETSVIALWLGHEHIQTTQIYLNPRELHQTREKAQVAC